MASWCGDVIHARLETGSRVRQRVFLRDECYECPYRDNEWYIARDGGWHRRCDECAVMNEEDDE